MNLPDFLYQRLIKQYSEEDVKKIIYGYGIKRVTSLRVNTTKTSVEKIKEELKINNINYQEVTWYSDALIVDANETEIKKLSIYENGEIYLQSLSSMLPPLILNPKANESILDMAAAPGGKTTEIANLSNHQSRITACEKNKIRCERLKYNLEKQGAKRVTVLMKDANELDDFFSFDKILLDAPCSGSGTICEGNINISNELIDKSVKRQRQLVQKAIHLLKENGELIYSTCSILKEENEEIVKEILKNPNFELIPINIDLFKNMPLLPVSLKGTLCVCPTESYEGFFVAKIKKIKK